MSTLRSKDLTLTDISITLAISSSDAEGLITVNSSIRIEQAKVALKNAKVLHDAVEHVPTLAAVQPIIAIITIDFID